MVITRKGGKVVTIPLASRTAQAIDLAIGERCAGPIFLTTDGRRRTARAPGASSTGPGGIPHFAASAGQRAAVPRATGSRARPRHGKLRP
jgi:hypothetical protein